MQILGTTPLNSLTCTKFVAGAVLTKMAADICRQIVFRRLLIVPLQAMPSPVVAAMCYVK